MSISSLASLREQNSNWTHSFYHTPHFQAFLLEVEEALEERLTEASAIAMSRANSNATDILCVLALEALLSKPEQHTKLASRILQER